VVVVVLPDHFRGIETRRNFTDTQQVEHSPRVGIEIKNRKCRAKHVEPKRLTGSRSRR